MLPLWLALLIHAYRQTSKIIIGALISTGADISQQQLIVGTGRMAKLIGWSVYVCVLSVSECIRIVNERLSKL